MPLPSIGDRPTNIDGLHLENLFDFKLLKSGHCERECPFAIMPVHVTPSCITAHRLMNMPSHPYNAPHPLLCHAAGPKCDPKKGSKKRRAPVNGANESEAGGLPKVARVQGEAEAAATAPSTADTPTVDADSIMAAASANKACYDKRGRSALKEVLDALGIDYAKNANKAALLAKIKGSDCYTKALVASGAYVLST